MKPVIRLTLFLLVTSLPNSTQSAQHSATAIVKSQLRDNASITYPTDQYSDKHSNSSHDGHVDHDGHGHSGPQIASFRWEEFRATFIITLTIILCSFFKLGFHKISLLHQNVPESCLLILLGSLVGLLCFLTAPSTDANGAVHHDGTIPKFTPNLFFNILLPPVILNSAFTIYDRDFLSNLSSVLVFAVFGTLFNVVVIGVTLYILSVNSLLGSACSCRDLTLVQTFIFSSLISAVDPVAVLAIFEEIHVNMSLYFLVFGESLLNDGVTIVLYNTMNSLVNTPVGGWEVFISICSFMFVTLGGCVIGILVGFVTSFTSRFTTDVRVIEPIFIFSLSYLAFILAELFHWSGIISIIAFGLTVKRYAFNNISKKSYTTVKYATQTLATMSDCIIFLFLGLVLFTEEHLMEPLFVVATVIICLVTRFLSTYLLAMLVNCRRVQKISYREQFVMAYGGLRGAVGFSLAMVLADNFQYKNLFLTTALVMVFFTVFIQGSTIKVLVKWLKITLKQEKEEMLTIEIQDRLMEDVIGGIEAITGRHGTFWLVERFKVFEKKYLKKFLLSSDSATKLYRKLSHKMIEKHYTHLYAPTIIASMKADEATETSTRQRSFSRVEDRSALRKGFKDSAWGRYKAGWVGMIEELNKRDERFEKFQKRISSYQQGDYISDIPEENNLEEVDGEGEKSRLLSDEEEVVDHHERTHMSPHLKLQRDSTPTKLRRMRLRHSNIPSIIDQYKQTQEKKRRMSEQHTRVDQYPNMLLFDLDETKSHPT